MKLGCDCCWTSFLFGVEYSRYLRRLTLLVGFGAVWIDFRRL